MTPEVVNGVGVFVRYTVMITGIDDNLNSRVKSNNFLIKSGKSANTYIEQPIDKTVRKHITDNWDGLL